MISKLGWHIPNPGCIRQNLEVVVTGTSDNMKMIVATINSSPPSVAYISQWIGSALIQTMVCRLFGDKPSSEPMLVYRTLGTNVCEILIKTKNYSPICIWKYHLRNGGHSSKGIWVKQGDKLRINLATTVVPESDLKYVYWYVLSIFNTEYRIHSEICITSLFVLGNRR